MRIVFLILVAATIAQGADVSDLLKSARAARAQHDTAAAQNAYESAFQLALSNFDRLLMPAAVELSGFYSQQQQPDKAELALKRALDAADSVATPELAKIHVLLSLSDLYSQQRRSADVAGIDARLVKVWETEIGPNAVVVANNLYRLGGALQIAGNLAEAEPPLRRAIDIFEKTYGADAQAVGITLERLADIEKKLGKDDLAAEARSRAETILEKRWAITPLTRGGPDQRAHKIGGQVKPPKLLDKREPSYSQEARHKRIQGTALLWLIVDTSGKPENITVLLPLGSGLDESAVEAVSQWRFSPGTKDGQAVRVQATIEVNFRLL